MSEQAETIAREAKGLQQSLKEALKSHDPWDKEVDIQRKNLRRRYLSLLLSHPYAKTSKDAETHLWMQTSYAFISLYKQRIATLDRAMQSSPRPQPQQARQGPPGPGPVEYRKLLGRFRQFLAEEEKFWTQLVGRLYRAFALHEAGSALVTLGIPTVENADLPDNHDSKEGDLAVTNGRDHFQIPINDGSVSVVPQTIAARESRLAILSKALVCLGDIARYRELYNESNGRPKAGHEDSTPSRRGRNRRGGGPSSEVVQRVRNYDKAKLCYEQARLLVPYEGNPSHQLAILASYQKETFTSLFHYYRALCVRLPYETASENLGNVLIKALEQWKARTKREREKGGVREPNRASLAPRLRVRAFEENLVVLHALWRLNIEKMDQVSPRQAQIVRDEFTSLVSERHLHPDFISETIVLSQGALWKHRMIRDPISTSSRKKSEKSLPPASSAEIIESRIFSHLLGLHTGLLEVGIEELAEAPPEETHLAQRITATFRRTLPALRIAGKWLRANFQYVMEHENESTSNGEVRGHSSGKQKQHSCASGTSQLWEFYARFSTNLLRTFPMERLPVPILPLEEDIEMRGFLPLRKMMGEAASKTGPQSEQTVEHGAVPNEEHLMRIADLLDDAKALVQMDNSPLEKFHHAFVTKGITSSSLRGMEHFSTSEVFELNKKDGEGDARTDMSSATDDYPVDEAFRIALDESHLDAEEEDEDDDEIVWNPRASQSPILPTTPALLPSPPSRPSPISPMKPPLSPIGSNNRSPSHSKGASFSASTAITGLTARDLLNSMAMPRSADLPRPSFSSESSAPQPPLLFGSEPPNRPGHSIWSTSLDDQSLKFAAASGQTSPLYQAQSHFPMQDPSQASWTSSFSNNSQNSQHMLPGAVPSSPFDLQPQSGFSGAHQRIPSSSLPLDQLQRNQTHSLYTSFMPSPGLPQPVQRPSAMPSHLPFANPLNPYGVSGHQDFHPAHFLSQHDPRIDQPFAPTPITQGWGNIR